MLLSPDCEQPCEVDADILVKDMWKSGSGWERVRIGDRLSHSKLLKLELIALNSSETNGDELGRLQAGSSFSVSLAYDLWRGYSEEGLWPGWSLIWAFKCQHHVKTFIWLLAHNGVLTNNNRWRRHLGDNPSYHKCDADKEDAIHVVRDCAVSTKVWECMPISSTSSNFYTMPLREWILLCLHH